MKLGRSGTSLFQHFHPIDLLEMEKENLLMNRQEAKARMAAANLNGRLDLDALNDAIRERAFAARVEANQHRLRSQLKRRAN